MGLSQQKIIEKIIVERFRQDHIWGTNEQHDIFKWLSILSEEVGEAHRAAQNGDKQNLEDELVQVAAVAIKILECGIKINDNNIQVKRR